MKRPWVIGCLALFLLVAGTAGALAYTYVVRPAMATVNAAKDLARIPEIEGRVRNGAAYAAPTDGLLTRDQVDRYVRTADRVRNELEAMGAELQARFDEIDESGGPRGPRELALAYADLLRLIVRAKEVQVEALNAEGFSLGEYAWVRTQTLSAAGLTAYDVDLNRLMAGEGAVRELGASVPQQNVELVRSVGVDLEQYLPLAAFGL